MNMEIYTGDMGSSRKISEEIFRLAEGPAFKEKAGPSVLYFSILFASAVKYRSFYWEE